MHYRSMRDELEGLPKIAVGILGALGHGLATGVAGHVGANVVGMAGHHGNIGEIMAHRGLQHALTGSKMNPAAEFSIKHLFGPEALSGYHAAHAAGAKLKDLPTDQMRAALAAGTVGSHLSPELRNSPILGDLGKAVEHELKGTTPELQTKGILGKLHGKALNSLSGRADTAFDGTGKKILNTVAGAAPVAAMTAVDAVATGGLPLGAGAHFGFNQLRYRLGRSEIGQKTMHSLATRGLRGETIGKGTELATNILASPGLLDPYRVGKAVHDTAERMGPTMHKTVQELGTTPYGQFGAKYDQAKGVVNNAMQTAQTAVNAARAVPPQGANMDKAIGGAALGAGALGAGYLGVKALQQPAQQAQPMQQIQKAAEEHEHEDPPEQNIFTIGSKSSRRGAIARRYLRSSVKSPSRLMAMVMAHNMSRSDVGDQARGFL